MARRSRGFGASTTGGSPSPVPTASPSEHRSSIAAEQSYTRAERDEAEERYGDYVDLVETGTELLADLRDHFATTLDEDVAEEYTYAFNRAVLKRFRRFALEIEDR